MNTSDQPLRLRSMIELASAVASREISPLEVLRDVTARIEEVEDKVNAFVTLDLERAEVWARQAGDELAKGRPAGLLEGIPVGIKDLVPTKGLRTTNCTPFDADRVPEVDGIEVERLKHAGAIIIGKTNSPAWGLKEMCENLVSGRTNNPWDLSRTSGGSSGGAGAAVAAGYGPFYHGTDGAGSVRIPAAWCGIYGFKPSAGRIPVWPTPDIWGHRIMIGALTRRVSDAALALEAMAGPDPRDPLSIEGPGHFLDALWQRPRRLRIAFSADLGFAPVNSDAVEAARLAAGVFEEAGHSVEEVGDPGWGDPSEWHTVIFRGGASTRLGPLYDARPEWIDPSVAEIIELGRGITKDQFVRAAGARTEFYNRAQAWMAGYDALLTPTMPCGAWPYDHQEKVGGQDITPVAGGRWPLMYSFNVTGWPAATVPCGFTEQGLPLGLQIVTPWHADELCLSLSALFEEARPWADLVAPVA